MRYFLTEYRAVGGARFGSELRARSYPAAVRMARRRRLGEKVLGEMTGSTRPTLVDQRPSKAFASRLSDVEKIHALVWLAFVALRSGAATVRDVFDDHAGFLHQAAHYLQRDIHYQGGRRAYRRRVLELIRKVERRVPGLP